MTQIRSAEHAASKLGDSELLCPFILSGAIRFVSVSRRWMNEEYCSQTLKLASKVGHPSSRSCHTMSMVRSGKKKEKKSAQFSFSKKGSPQSARRSKTLRVKSLGAMAPGVLAMCQGNSAEARAFSEQSVVLGKNFQACLSGSSTQNQS